MRQRGAEVIRQHVQDVLLKLNEKVQQEHSATGEARQRVSSEPSSRKKRKRVSRVGESPNGLDTGSARSPKFRQLPRLSFPTDGIMQGRLYYRS
jgi:hypothetical protein